MIVKNLVSFRTLTNSEEYSFLLKKAYNRSPHSIREVLEIIHQSYDFVKQCIIKQLDGKQVCLSADEWISRGGKDYIVKYAHYFENQSHVK